MCFQQGQKCKLVCLQSKKNAKTEKGNLTNLLPVVLYQKNGEKNFDASCLLFSVMSQQRLNSLERTILGSTSVVLTEREFDTASRVFSKHVVKLAIQCCQRIGNW